GLFGKRPRGAPARPAQWEGRDLPRATARVLFGGTLAAGGCGPLWRAWAGQGRFCLPGPNTRLDWALRRSVSSGRLGAIQLGADPGTCRCAVANRRFGCRVVYQRGVAMPRINPRPAVAALVGGVLLLVWLRSA